MKFSSSLSVLLLSISLAQAAPSSLRPRADLTVTFIGGPASQEVTVTIGGAESQTGVNFEVSQFSFLDDAAACTVYTEFHPDGLETGCGSTPPQAPLAYTRNADGNLVAGSYDLGPPQMVNALNCYYCAG